MRWLLLGALISVPATGWAADDICQIDPKCRAYSSSGAQSFQGHDYVKALRQFELAYSTRPEPRLLINIGRCKHRLGRPEEAIVSYERFMQDQPSPDSTTKALLNRYLTEARAAKAAAPSQDPAVGQAAAGSDAQTSEQASKRGRPFYKTWWFWTATGATVAVVSLGIGLGVGLRPSHPYKEIIWQPLP